MSAFGARQCHSVQSAFFALVCSPAIVGHAAAPSVSAAMWESMKGRAEQLGDEGVKARQSPRIYHWSRKWKVMLQLPLVRVLEKQTQRLTDCACLSACVRVHACVHAITRLGYRLWLK